MFSEISYDTNLFINRIQIILGIILFSGLNKLSQKYIPDKFTVFTPFKNTNYPSFISQYMDSE